VSAHSTLSYVLSRAFLIAIAVLLVIAGGWAAFLGRNTSVPAHPAVGRVVSFATSSTKGSESAPLAVVEWSDFQCPFCGRFARDTQPQLFEEYVSAGKVLWVFKHLPLKRHQHARRAALQAQCATRQGRFWELHDVFFGQQAGLKSLLNAPPSHIGLDLDAFRACVQEMDDRFLQADIREAETLRISGTTTFLIGRTSGRQTMTVTSIVRGSAPAGAFSRALDAALVTVH
jgi:protein-disulfide isomerase